MLKKIGEQLTDIVPIDSTRIENILASGKTATIQFSKRIYTTKHLTEVDSLCRRFGEDIHVRFYGHDSTGFDAAHVEHIPNVHWLSIDCLNNVKAPECLSNLAHLKKLSLGISELDMPDILAGIQARNIHELRLGDTRKNNIDLSPLTRFTQLENLIIASHCTGFSVLGQLSELTELRLRSIPKNQPLNIIGSIPKLQKLSIILGGRPNVDEISHTCLNQLEIIRVLGFSSIGNLSRFPGLQKLHIEDQIRLESMDLNNASTELLQLALGKCKNLKRLGRLSHLVKLHDVGLVLTGIPFETLITSPLPPSLRTVRFMTGKAKADRAYADKLLSMGYDQFSD